MPRTASKPKRPRKTGGRGGPRASWKGLLRLGLVSVPVQAFNAAAKKQEIHFHQLHAACHSRIRYEKVCPIHGEIENSEIVSGYEYAKGQYVEIHDEELDSLRSEKDKALTIESFIHPEAIDPIYFDGRVYYLVPSGTEGQEPYAVLREAIDRQGLYGIGQVVFSGREQLVVVRPIDGLLGMQMLNFENQLRTPQMFEGELGNRKPSAREISLAERLIEAQFEEEFDFGRYQDEYQNKLRTLIQAKVEGEELVSPPVEEEPEVINLMDALRKSVARAQAESRKAGGRQGDGEPRREKAGGRKRSAS
jgi:DNA end-binding protein Ku